MSNVINIESSLPHAVSEVICVKCGYRYISVRPISVLLKKMQCSKCKKTGFIIETGQDLEVSG